MLSGHRLISQISNRGRDSKDENLPEMFIRPGAIIPSAPVTQHFGDRPDSRDELTLIVHLNADGEAFGSIYEDDGESFGYMMGQYLMTNFKAIKSNGIVSVEVVSQEGKLEMPGRKIIVRIVGE